MSRTRQSPRVDVALCRQSPIFSPSFQRRNNIQRTSSRTGVHASINQRADGVTRSVSVPVNKPSVDSVQPDYGTLATEEELPMEMKSTVPQTICNGINLLLGVGVLSLPFALRMSGWILGLGILIGLTILTNYTGKLIGLIIDEIRVVNNSPNMLIGFEDMGYEAFGKRGRVFISAVFIIELGSACALYLVVMGDNLSAVFPEVPEFWLILIIAALCLPTTWLANLAWLSYFSILGVIASLFLFTVVLIQGASIPHNPEPGMPTGSFLHPSKTTLYTSIDQWPLCFGLIMVGYAGHAVFPSLYTGMQDTKMYRTVLNITYLVVGGVYISLAVLGYLMYGQDTLQEVTLNLSKTSALSKVALWLIVINPATKFALTLHPVAISVEDLIYDCVEAKGITVKNERMFGLIVRTCLTVFITIIAVSVPYFARIVSFVGAFCSFTVSGSFPLMCYEKIFIKQMPPAQLWFNRFLIAFCILGAFWGTAATFYASTS